MNLKSSSSANRVGLATMACLAFAWVAAVASAQGPLAPPQSPPPPAITASEVQGYSLPAPEIGPAVVRLQEQYARRPDVRIAGDERLGQVIVIGPREVQQEIATWFGEQKLAAQARPLPSMQPTALAAPSQPLVTQAWQLKNLSWKDFENRLLSTWGKRLEASQDSVGDMATFRFPPSAAGSTSILVDRRSGLVTIAAPHTTANSWQRLMGILDSRPQSLDEKTTIVPLTKADPSIVQKAIALVQQVGSRAATDSKQPSASDLHRKQHIGQFVSMIFQPTAGEAAAAPPAPAPVEVAPGETVQVGGAPLGSVAEAIARIGNVQIEILDDVVIVRGRAQDVERVMQIIEQIEQQSLAFRPEVEIVFLKHVNGEAISAMIAQVYAAAFSRQGPVTIVPLGRPNALMLIGRKENIPAIIELIQKLDQPAPMDAEFKVFPLKFMSAIDAERVIRQFFVDRPGTNTNLRTGLGTRVIVIGEYRSNTLLVQASPRDMAEVERLIESLDVGESPVKNEVRIIKLKNAIAADLAPVLQEAITGTTATTAAQAAQGGGAAGAVSPARAIPPALNLQFLQIGEAGQQLIQTGILASMRISADARSNALMIVGPANAMELIEAVIRQLDQLPSLSAQVKVFTLKNGDATALATMLQNLFGITQAAGAAGGAQAGQTATGAGESTLVPLRFSVDQRTNTIIASGNQGDLDVVYAILARLDQGDVRQRITTVYRLSNAPAADVANALSGAAGLFTLQQNLIQTAPELVTPIEVIERQVIVVAEPVTNSLIVSATPAYLQEIRRIIEQLDRRPPMVVIQVVIAEVRLGDTEQFGVEWGLQDALMFDRSILSNRYNFEGPGTATLPNDNSAASIASRENVAGQALANFGLNRVDPTLGFGGLVLTASSESVSVLLRALEVSSRAQVISRPQVQSLDNQPAFVQVGSLVPRITSSTLTTTGVTNGTVDTNVGIILQVTPRTSPDGMIAMQISAEKSAVGPDASGIPISITTDGEVIRSPQILITTAQTTVSAKSGQTVILGGLITNDQFEQTNRIPYLGDIPVLGRLFRFDAVTRSRTELLIILTPFLIKSDEQTDWINARETERMSWCVSDVVNIHGTVPVAGNMAFNNGATPIIFPDVDPGAPNFAPPPGAFTPGPLMPQYPPTIPPPPQQPMGTNQSWPTIQGLPPANINSRQPSVLVPAARPLEGGALMPQTIQPATPPAGTSTALIPAWNPGFPPIAPASYQPPIPR